MRARFGPGVEVCVRADDDTLGLAVPALFVQPLVENAFRHGRAASGRGRVEVRARRDRDQLHVDVRNDVPPEPIPATSGGGLGLSLTRERLRLLHGDRHVFRSGQDGDGWYEVAVTLPARDAAAGHE
jgi:two-component system sensor histidine kinase AlgZ